MLQTKLVEKIKMHVVCSIIPPPKNHDAYDTVLKNTVEMDRPHMTIRCTCFSCWIPKAMNTHS